MDENEKVARSTGNVIFFICVVADAHDRGLVRPEWSRDARRLASRASSFLFHPPSPRGVVQAF